MVTLGSATDTQRERLLGMIFGQLDSDTQSAFEYLGITQQEFVQLYYATGEIHTVWQDDQLAGFVWIEHRERDLHIHGIVLLEEWRGQGIGTQVFHLLESECSNDVEFIELGVQTSNDGALRFYRRTGFQPIEREIPTGFAVLRKPILCQ